MEHQHSPQLSIVIPVINEGKNLPDLFQRLRQLNTGEVIFVDGGSSDNTKVLILQTEFVLLESAPGRGQQMNAGAAHARGEIVIFLHADTLLPASAPQLIIDSLQTINQGWGRFDVIIDGPGPVYRAIAFLMNWRSRITGIVTGDQVMFVHRNLFEAIGGFANIPLMEDVEISTRLNKQCPPVCLTQKVVTSGRRWRKKGVLKTITLMWWLRFAFWVGIRPERLARWYR